MRSPAFCRRLFAAGALLALPVAALAQPTIDGQNIPSEFSDAPTSVTQRFQTQFGDHNGGPFASGSELNRMFLKNDGDKLYIGITGNLENNGNCLVILIDVDGDASGENVVLTQSSAGPIDGIPRYLTGGPGTGANIGLHKLKLDDGFNPDYALGISGGSPRGSQTRTYYLANWTTLATSVADPNDMDPGAISNVVAGMITDSDATASGATPGTLGNFLATGTTGILGASYNENDIGVGGGPSAVDPNQPETAVDGFEFSIPLSLLGVTENDNVCVLALVSSPDGYMSNQFLPTDQTSSSLENYAFPPLNLKTVGGDQFICHTITGGGGGCGPGCGDGAGDADLDDDCDVDLTDLALLLSDFDCTGGCTGDTNGDGNTDLTDLARVLSFFDATCP